MLSRGLACCYSDLILLLGMRCSRRGDTRNLAEMESPFYSCPFILSDEDRFFSFV